jgi:RES domain-containing protein
LWRIATGLNPVWSGEGARLFGQRWNPAGLAAARCVEAVAPEGVSRETFLPGAHPGWDDLDDASVAQAFGQDWIQSRRSALLIVPSVVTGGRDANVVVNPDHPDAARIEVGPETRVALDPRLFGP